MSLIQKYEKDGHQAGRRLRFLGPERGRIVGCGRDGAGFGSHDSLTPVKNGDGDMVIGLT